MSEITTKKLSEYTVAELRAMLPQYAKGYKKVTSLPATIDEGEIVLYGRKLYRGLATNESSLPAGTPWPVIGYKELLLKANITIGDTNAWGSVIFEKSDFSSVTKQSSNTGLANFTLIIDDPQAFPESSYVECFVNDSDYFLVSQTIQLDNKLHIICSVNRVFGTSLNRVAHFNIKVFAPFAAAPIPPVGN